MNLLNRTRVYLAGALEYASDAISWREYLKGQLGELGIVCINPNEPCLTNEVGENEETRKEYKELRAKGDLESCHKFFKEIVRRDTRLIDLCDFAIIRVQPDIVSWGTPHELGLLTIQHKAVLIWIDDLRRVPFWVLGLVNPKCIFDDIDELILYLYNLNNGQIEMDRKYWKLLYNNLR